MSNSKRQLCSLALSTLVGMSAAAPALADDTEIYTGLNNAATTVDPNVMFVIDTSGSMGIFETLAVAQYVPGTTYTGSCSTSRVYFSTNGQVPSCGTSQYFEKSSFRCDAADTPLFSTTSAGTGIYQDRFARYSAGSFFFAPSWSSLSTAVHAPPHVECQDDEGIHGENASSSAKFITLSGSQPYTTDANQKKNWNSTGSFLTLYSANYMNYFNNSSNTQSARRIDIVKDVVKELIDSNNNLNVALMRFDRNAHGGPIIFPFTDIDGSGVKTNFKTAVDSLSAAGNTPLSETLSEALRVFRGDNAVFGLSPPANSNTVSVAGSFETGTKYDSPMDVQCQKNFIVFLSDGEPTSDSEANSFTNTLLSNVSLPSRDTTCGGSDNCLDEIAEFMNATDLVPGLDGKQNVITYTIGFGSTAAGSTALNALLQQTGSKGGGDAFIAQDFRQLSNVFTQIITEIQAVNSTFTAPAVSVNAFNRVTNREELFFTLFKPKESPVWTGNMKRYRLGLATDGNGDVVPDADGDGILDEPEVRDLNNNKAVDPKTGFFATSSTSFWSELDAPDGDETGRGGAARKLGGNADPFDRTQRFIYSNLSSTNNDLSASVNRANIDNSTLTSDRTLVGLSPDPQPAGEPIPGLVYLWLGGQDVLDEDGDGSRGDARAVMGDPLHAQPLLLEYGPAPTTANPNPTSDITIYMTTNEGMLHAIDSDDGTEVFSFIPKQQLAKVATYYENSGTGFKEYGLDGPLAVYFKDTNGNGFLDTGAPDNDRYILIFGERRGGRRYYAVDVTNRSAPQYLWTITGGTGDFHELGQTWSEPQQAKIKLNGTVQDVMVFGGGYDATNGDQEDTARAGHTTGRAIYMINPLTGAKVWYAGDSSITTSPIPDLRDVCFITTTAKDCAKGDMDFSIPANIRLVELDGDGLLDRIYASDTGGQLLRIDIDNTATTPGALADGYIVADVQRATPGTTTSSLTAADNRRFYYPPDPALIAPAGGDKYISLSIGSGFRAHPLNTTVQDKMFMVQDLDPFTKPTNYRPTVTLSKLQDLTDPTTAVDLVTNDGWFINLVNSSGQFVGEKVLSVATTFQGTLFFTTFSPVGGVSAASCAPNQGAGKVFSVSVEDASAIQNFEPVDGGSTTSDPRVVSTLVRTGIPPEVTILFPPESNTGRPIGLVAAERLRVPFDAGVVKTYWFQQETQ